MKEALREICYFLFVITIVMLTGIGIETVVMFVLEAAK
jgi:hypothetical protein